MLTVLRQTSDLRLASSVLSCFLSFTVTDLIQSQSQSYFMTGGLPPSHFVLASGPLRPTIRDFFN
jgi:hypothetical protein